MKKYIVLIALVGLVGCVSGCAPSTAHAGGYCTTKVIDNLCGGQTTTVHCNGKLKSMVKCCPGLDGVSVTCYELYP